MIDRLLGHDRFTVIPRRGELIVFDKLARPLVDHIVLPVPTALGKGVLVSPTIYGNVMLGPTAENITDRGDTAPPSDGFDFLLGKGRRLMPALLEEEVTATYAGLRAATEHDDYLIDVDPSQRYVLVGGIRSTGLTASMASPSTSWTCSTAPVWTSAPARTCRRRRACPTSARPSRAPTRTPTRIAADPEYGRIVCFCERVTARRDP